MANPFRQPSKVWVYEHRIGAFRFGDLCMSESRVGGTPGEWYVPESKLKKVKAERDQAKAQALAELREGLADAVADRFTYLAQHSSAPTAWYAAAQEFNVLLEDLIRERNLSTLDQRGES